MSKAGWFAGAPKGEAVHSDGEGGKMGYGRGWWWAGVVREGEG